MPTDPSSPSTSSARDAVVEAMGRAWWKERGFVGEWGWAGEKVRQDRIRRGMAHALDAALGVTYTPEACKDCAPTHPGYRWVKNDVGSNMLEPCPNHAPRLALIDVLVACGALEGPHAIDGGADRLYVELPRENPQ